jgi:hypothetical protein
VVYAVFVVVFAINYKTQSFIKFNGVGLGTNADCLLAEYEIAIINRSLHQYFALHLCPLQNGPVIMRPIDISL